MTEKKTKRKQTKVPKKPTPKPVSPVGGGQGGLLTGPGNGLGVGR